MTNSPPALVVGAFGLALLALGLSVTSFLRSSADDGGGGAGSAVDDARLTSLEEQVARLADRVGRGADTTRARVAPVDGSESGTDPATVDQRLDALEEAVEDVADSLADTSARVDAFSDSPPVDPMRAIRAAVPTAEQVAELRKLVLDTNAESRPRLLALRALARVPDGRNLEIARAMRKLFEESDDEYTRSGVVALLEGVVEPELEPWLVETLRSDRYSSTRESATDALSHYVGSQRVRDALADAVENDSNHDVRSDAQNALDKLAERER